MDKELLQKRLRRSSWCRPAEPEQLLVTTVSGWSRREQRQQAGERRQQGVRDHQGVPHEASGLRQEVHPACSQQVRQEMLPRLHHHPSPLNSIKFLLLLGDNNLLSNVRFAALLFAFILCYPRHDEIQSPLNYLHYTSSDQITQFNMPGNLTNCYYCAPPISV
jgi:hypothetical protein